MNRWLAGLLCSFFAVLGSGVPPAAAQMLMNGAGATFPYPIYSKWFDEYAKVDPNARVNYTNIGTSAGKRTDVSQRRYYTRCAGPPINEIQEVDTTLIT